MHPHRLPHYRRHGQGVGSFYPCQKPPHCDIATVFECQSALGHNAVGRLQASRMGSLSPPAHLHGGGRSTSASASFQHNGCRAGRLACWHNVTAERSRPVPSHLIPPSHESWSTQQPSSPAANTPRAVIVLLSSLAATPQSWSGRTESDDRLRSISCTSPAMVFHRQPLGHEPSPRPVGRPQKRVVKPSLASFPHGASLCLPHKTFEIFSRLPHLLMPSLVLGVPTLQSARHVSVKTIRLLGVVRTIYPFKR